MGQEVTGATQATPKLIGRFRPSISYSAARPAPMFAVGSSLRTARSTPSQESAPMRLEQLILRIPGDEFQVRFHEHLTVLSGIGLLERQALADSVMGALTGGAENAVVTLRDHTGRPIEIVCRGGAAVARYLD